MIYLIRNQCFPSGAWLPAGCFEEDPLPWGHGALAASTCAIAHARTHARTCARTVAQPLKTRNKCTILKAQCHSEDVLNIVTHLEELLYLLNTLQMTYIAASFLSTVVYTLQIYKKIFSRIILILISFLDLEFLKVIILKNYHRQMYFFF